MMDKIPLGPDHEARFTSLKRWSKKYGIAFNCTLIEEATSDGQVFRYRLDFYGSILVAGWPAFETEPHQSPGSAHITVVLEAIKYANVS